MGEAVMVMFDDVIYSVKERKFKDLSRWRQREDALDNLQKEITRYLARVVQKDISPDDSREIASLLRMVNNFERIGDAIENIAELGEELIEQDIRFSEGGWQDFKIISMEAQKFIGLVVEGLAREEDIMTTAQNIENSIRRYGW